MQLARFPQRGQSPFEGGSTMQYMTSIVTVVVLATIAAIVLTGFAIA